MSRLNAEIIERMKNIVGHAGVLMQQTDLSRYTSDWKGRFTGSTDAVLLPRSTVEVASLVRLCTSEGIAVIPQGGNTGLSGGSVPLHEQPANVILGLGRMNRIIDISRENSTITVEAGVVLQSVQEAADSVNRFFPLSLGAEGSCQIGGNLSTNAGGTAVLRYGNARDAVLGLEVVLPNGDIWNGLRTLRKDNTGYDIKSIFLGAEGTLGIITGAVLKLYSRPLETAVAWVAVDGMASALRLLTELRDAFESRLSAFEYVSREHVDLVLRHVPGHVDPLADKTPGYVLMEVSDTLRTDALSGMLESALADAIESGIASNAVIATSQAQAASLWNIRHAISEAIRAHGVSLNHDVAVPTGSLPAFTAEATEQVHSHFPEAEVVTVAHMGDGNVHFLVIFPRDFWATLSDANDYIAQVHRLVYTTSVKHQGTFSAEHGIGQSLTAEMSHFKSPVELDLMHRIKAMLDPKCLMNPGKVLPSQGNTLMNAAFKTKS